MMMNPTRVHGGRLNAAVRESNIPREQWLDLSTGINPNGYPVPALPAEVWQRLPEDDDEVVALARQWFARCVDENIRRDKSIGCLPVAGSQAALQLLPTMRAPCRVGVPAVGYAEHEWAWRDAGHEVVRLQPEEIASALPQLDVLVCINPNNPTGDCLTVETLIAWHQQLSRRGGWLIVDEAFVDASRAQSLASYFYQLADDWTDWSSKRDDDTDANATTDIGGHGLIILRSLGKFFGLAGLRAGAMFAAQPLCNVMAQRLGPWALSHPARYVMALALADIHWQADSAARLRVQHRRLLELLSGFGFSAQGNSDLFVYCRHPDAARIAAALARQAVLVRCFEQPPALRFGLPGGEHQWRQLQQALSAIATYRGDALNDAESDAESV